ncbi:MAG: undecaprenyl-diphosphate phosphatase [Bacteroidales bacterium]|nr:undecaprenyl-diphosphate phosphatase [Bacteroidales bacterium]
MEWWQSILLGIVQGLTEFLPVSSSGHLMITKAILGVDGEGFLDFTVLVHLGTVCSTLVVFRKEILSLFAGLFKFRYNDETDYVLKLVVSMIPVAFVGLVMKDFVEGLFGESLFVVAVSLVVTAMLLFFSDRVSAGRRALKEQDAEGPRNGISYWQAFVVGIGQAFAVAPGLSRSGTTIAVGLLSGVKREVIAQFSFLMVLVPILGEQLLSVAGGLSEGGSIFGEEVSAVSLALGFAFSFLSGLFACKVMIALVKRAKLIWFALYCAAVALLILLLGV